MPVTPTYPGVYIEEVASPVRTIVGVATSITAFVGRAKRGPIDKPRVITTWGDFESIYGGLWRHSTMSYAVQQYFLNGGSQAVIARVVHVDSDGTTTAAAAALRDAAGRAEWRFQATTVGAAGNGLVVRVAPASEDANDLTRFNLELMEADGTPIEVIENLRVSELAPGQVLGGEGLLSVEGEIPTLRPTVNTTITLRGGADPAFASVALETSAAPATLAAAIAGRAGNDLRATVGDATGGGATDYDLLLELLDADGDRLASTLYADLTAGAGSWPSTPSESFGTTVPLIDVTGAPPAARPANVERARFDEGSDAERAFGTVGVTVSGLPLRAKNPGEWGNRLRAAFDHRTSTPTDVNLFNVFVRELDEGGQEVRRETFRNVSLRADSARYVKKVLDEGSELIQLTGSSWSRPPETPRNADGDFVWLEFGGGNDGDALDNGDFIRSQDGKTGIYLLEHTDLFSLLVIPPPTRDVDVSPSTWQHAMKYCRDRRALLLVDPPASWTSKKDVVDNLDGLGLQGADSINAALYWPYIKVADPLSEFRLESFPPAGAIAGLMARNDAQRGVWSAPAGIEASVTGAQQLVASLTDLEHGQVNPRGVNVIRSFPVIGSVVWGARTLRGADALASEWQYLPVRRLALMIEESLYRGTQWAVFQGNDEPLWAQLRLNVRAFMHNLFRQGAFQGSSPREAYLVKCDAETTTQYDIDRGIVNVLVGFRPLKPAEFVFLKISQLAGEAAA